MAAIVNLRSARKAKARADARAKAEVTAAKFGRTKGQKAREAADNARAAAALEASRLDRKPD